MDGSSNVMREYLDLNAEAIPSQDMDKPSYEVFYLPVHAVYKNSSTTTKIRALFHVSAKSSSDVSLNDILLAIHIPLIDVLLRFDCVVLLSPLMSVKCTGLLNLLSLTVICIALSADSSLRILSKMSG